MKERRVRGDLIEAFKTLKGINKVEKSEWFDIRTNKITRPTRGNTVMVDGAERMKIETLYLYNISIFIDEGSDGRDQKQFLHGESDSFLE